MATAAWGNTYIKDNSAQTAPALVTTDGDIVVATAANALKRLAAMGGGDTFLHEVGGLEADVNAGDGFVEIKGGSTTVIKSNLAASDAPDANDDSGSGYAVGSIWIDTTNDQAYVCVDASSTAAVWSILAFAQANQAAIEAETNENTYIPPDLIKHSPGVAKAWLRQGLSGTTPTIDADYGISTLGETGTGDIDVNFTTAFSTANYAPAGMAANAGTSDFVLSGSSLTTVDYDLQLAVGGTLTDGRSFTSIHGDQ